jgi:hypothetical protein
LIYPGDNYTILFSLSNANGSTPNVTTAPLLTVIQLSTGNPVVSAQAMTLVTGTTLVYSYPWNTTGLQNGDYLAVVSYAAGGNTFNGQFLEQLRLGDTNITGPVALAANVALNATVAKDATVAHLTDLATINPNTSTVVLAIQSAVNAIPNNLATQDSVNLLVSLLTDVHDGQFGTWSVDKTQSPKMLSFYRLDGSVLATYAVTEDVVSSSCRNQKTSCAGAGRARSARRQAAPLRGKPEADFRSSEFYSDFMTSGDRGNAFSLRALQLTQRYAPASGPDEPL